VAASDQLKVRIVGDADSLRKELQNSQQRVGKFASKTETASKKTKKFGRSQKKAADQSKSMGKATGVAAAGALGKAAGAAGAAAAAIGGLAKKTAEHADRSMKTARQVGVEVETYQELEFALGQYGLTQKETEKTMTKFIRRIGEAKSGNKQYKEAVDKLGVSLKNQQGEMRSQSELFNSSIKRLGEMENAQERAAVAADLFGQKAGPKLASAIEGGADGIKELRSRAQELGIVVGEETAKQAESFNDSLDTLKKSGLGLVRTLGSDLIPVFNEMLKIVKSVVIPAVKTLADVLGPVVQAAAKGLKNVVDGIISGLQSFADTVKSAYNSIAEYNPLDALKSGFSGGGLHEDMTALDRVLAGLGKTVKEVSDAFRSGGLGEALSTLGDRFAELWPDVKDALQTILEKAGNWIADNASTIAKRVGEWGKKFVEWIEEYLPDILRELGNLLDEVTTWMRETGLPTLSKKLEEWADAFVDWIGPKIPPMLRKLGDLLEEVADWIANEGLPKLVDKLGKWAEAFVEWVGPKIPPLIEELWNLLDQVMTWATETGLPKLTEKLDEWASAFVDWIAPQIPKMLKKFRLLLGEILTWMVTTALPEMVKKIVKWRVAFVKWILTDALPMILKNLGKLLAAILKWLVTDALPALDRQLKKWQDAFIAWVGDVISKIPGALADLLSTIGGWVVDDALPTIKDKLGEWVSAFVDWVKDAIESLPEKLEELAQLIIDWAKELPGKITNALGDLGGSIADAAGSGLKRAGSWANPFGDGPGVQGAPVGGSARQIAEDAMAAVPGKQYITSGYRTPQKNALVGGSPTSYHLDEQNPAVDIGGENLSMVFSYLARAPRKLRELLGPPNAADHQDHVHVAHRGGRVSSGWPRQPGDRADERTARLQVGETVIPRMHSGGTVGGADSLRAAIERLSRSIDMIAEDEPESSKREQALKSLRAKRELRREQLQNYKEMRFEAMSPSEQIADLNRRIEAEKEYTDEWRDLVERRDRIRKQQRKARRQEAEEHRKALQSMAEAESKYRKKMASAAEKYSEKISDINAGLSQQIAEAVESRKDALRQDPWSSPAGEVSAGKRFGGSGFSATGAAGGLAANLRRQAKQISNWQESLSQLQERGFGRDDLQTLGLTQGPGQAKRARSLLSSSSDQLAALRVALDSRSDAISEAVGRERGAQGSALSSQIDDARREAAAQRAQAKRARRQAERGAARRRVESAFSNVGVHPSLHRNGTVVDPERRLSRLTESVVQGDRTIADIRESLEGIREAVEADKITNVELDGDVVASSVSSRQASSLRTGARSG